MPLRVTHIKNNPVDSNCFLIYDESINTKCLVVDPGCKDSAPLKEQLAQLGLTPEAILLTHEHFDHIWSCNYLYAKYRIPTYASRLCTTQIESARQNCSRYYDPPGFETHIETRSVETQDWILSWNGHAIRFFSTPGHSDASVCFIAGSYLFTGDTLIAGLRTVTNLPSGSKEKLSETISKLKDLQGAGYTVCPGHGAIFQLDDYDLTRMIK